MRIMRSSTSFARSADAPFAGHHPTVGRRSAQAWQRVVGASMGHVETSRTLVFDDPRRARSLSDALRDLAPACEQLTALLDHVKQTSSPESVPTPL